MSLWSIPGKTSQLERRFLATRWLGNTPFAQLLTSSPRSTGHGVVPDYPEDEIDPVHWRARQFKGAPGDDDG